MHSWARRGDVRSLEYVAEHQSSELVHAVDESGRTPLMLAADCGSMPCVELLLSLGVAMPRRGWPCSVHALLPSVYLTLDSVILRRVQATVDAEDSQGMRAVEYAVLAEHDEIVHLLLAKGAAPPLDVAVVFFTTAVAW